MATRVAASKSPTAPSWRRWARRESRPACSRQVSARATQAGDFVWKGGSDGLADAWFERGLVCEPEGSGARWWLLDAGKPSAKKGDVVLLLHDLPAYSYLWRDVVEPATKAGKRVVAPDLLGFGSSVPGPGFGYTLAEHVSELSLFVDDLGLPPVALVGHGLVGGLVAAVFAGENPTKVASLTLLNAPLDKAALEVPKPFKPLLNPLLGSITAQNPLAVVGKPIEQAGPYALDVNDQAAYQQPALENGNFGFGLIELIKQYQKGAPAALARALDGLAAPGAPPVTVAWSDQNAWIAGPPDTAALPFTPAKVLKLAGTGHFAPEDWADKVAGVVTGKFAGDA